MNSSKLHDVSYSASYSGDTQQHFAYGMQDGVPVAWQCPFWMWGLAEVGWLPAHPLGVLSIGPDTPWPVHSLQPPPPAPVEMQELIRHIELLMVSFGLCWAYKVSPFSNQARTADRSETKAVTLVLWRHCQDYGTAVKVQAHCLAVNDAKLDIQIPVQHVCTSTL